MPKFVLKALRTPLGALGGSLKSFSAPELAGVVLRALLDGFDPARVEECVLGQAVQAGSGANPAREAARLGGLPPVASAITLNQGHASGLKAVILASRGETDLTVAGGVESSSGAPYLLPSARWGTRMGSAPILDALILDAQWPPREEGRREADRQRTMAAREAGFLGQECVPLGSGQDDLPPSAGALLPADGAALVLLGTERAAAGHAPLARILACARGEGEGEAIRRALLKAGLALESVDRFELDAPGAFPDLPGDRSNAWGSALTLGLAQGAEGARKLVTLTHQLRVGKLRYGVAALEADGIGLALVLENLS